MVLNFASSGSQYAVRNGSLREPGQGPHMYKVQQIHEAADPPVRGRAQHLRNLLREELPVSCLQGEYNI